jgi:hypothetical protein
VNVAPPPPSVKAHLRSSFGRLLVSLPPRIRCREESIPTSLLVDCARPAFGALDSLGTIQPGRLADLVLLDADPLAHIRNTRRIHRVIANGRLIDRAALLRRAAAFARR